MIAMKTNNETQDTIQKVITSVDLMDAISPENGRLVLTLGGRGGVGKTLIATAIIDCLRYNNIEPRIIDTDEENDKAGCLRKFYPEAQKIDIHVPRALDAIASIAADNAVTVADLGASSGKSAFPWFKDTFKQWHDLGVRVTLVGVVTSSPSGVESLLTWANELKNKVDYVVVLNQREGDEFFYLHQTASGKAFLEKTTPPQIVMRRRLIDITQALESRGLSLLKALTSPPEVLGDFLATRMNRIRMRSDFDAMNLELAKAQHLFQK